MKLSPIVYYAVALWMSFVPSATATEDSNGRRHLRGEETYNGPVAEGEQVFDRELEGEIVTPELIAERNKELDLAFEAENGNERKLLVDPRCKVWCLGFQRGYCQNFYPRCDPLRRDLEGEIVTAELIAERNKELDLAFEAENGNERKLLVDPRCKVWCLGFQRGYCQNFYPRCDPLRRDLEGEIVTAELIAERNKELDLAFEAENGNERKLLVDPRCKVWCLGFQRGYCQNFYPRCDPLRRDLAGETVTAELIAERNKELDLAFEAENGNERKLLVDPRCKVWCLGFQRGYCQNFYPRCDPL
jgi:hypothetical protein